MNQTQAHLCLSDWSTIGPHSPHPGAEQNMDMQLASLTGTPHTNTHTCDAATPLKKNGSFPKHLPHLFAIAYPHLSQIERDQFPGPAGLNQHL